MTTLHMVVETARSTQNNINNTHSQFTSMLQSMSSSVSGLQSDWMGNSATEFFGEYEQWRSTMNSMIESLGTLNTRLGNEISEWEAAAAKLA